MFTRSAMSVATQRLFPGSLALIKCSRQFHRESGGVTMVQACRPGRKARLCALGTLAGVLAVLAPGMTPGVAAAELKFRRGDANASATVDLSDAVRTLMYLFAGGVPLPCHDAADANDDGKLDLTDGVHILNYLFVGGVSIPEPGPDVCGLDPTADV